MVLIHALAKVYSMKTARKVVLVAGAQGVIGRAAAEHLALASGEVAEARRLTEEALASHASATVGDWAKFRDITSWPDAWLVAAVRRDPPDEASLDVLVDRYWKHLFARCQILALNSQKAIDLARETWCQVLRPRRSLRSEGNFPADLIKIATKLWRKSHLPAPQTGPMTENRLASIHAEISKDSGETAVRENVLPDLNTLQPMEQMLLKLDIDQALGGLTALLRDVLVSRFLTASRARKSDGVTGALNRRSARGCARGPGK